ncbi:hypothetical protein D3C72_1791610 [compost metagenome]
MAASVRKVRTQRFSAISATGSFFTNRKLKSSPKSQMLTRESITMPESLRLPSMGPLFMRFFRPSTQADWSL